MMEAKAVPC